MKLSHPHTKMFKIEWQDDVGNVRCEHLEFDSWAGRAECNGQPMGPILVVTAEDWARDYAYAKANKGWHRVTEVKT